MIDSSSAETLAIHDKWCGCAILVSGAVWKLRDLCDDEFNRGDDVREVNRRQGGADALDLVRLQRHRWATCR